MKRLIFATLLLFACSERDKPAPPAAAVPTPPPQAVTCATFSARWVAHEGVDPVAAAALTSACEEAGDLDRHRAAVECYLRAPSAAEAKQCKVRPMVDAWFATRD